MTVVPVAAVQVPHELMRNHQLVGPFASARSTDRSLFTVAAKVGPGDMVNDDEAIW